MLLDWPAEGKVSIRGLNDRTSISTRGIQSIELLGSAEKLAWKRDGDGLHVTFPVERPCDHAYALKI